ncbi:MAG TPA: macro domain-containing protein [Solirubrobacterales bacterium]|nr:macro domain-containing protein [Solirubrobacterales bacterium]
MSGITIPTLQVVRGDIARETSDAIVNAANPELKGGGGVDGAIHRAAGPEVLEACRSLGGCEIGDAKATGAGAISARFIIHAVGPIWSRESKAQAAELLARCHRRAVEVADGLEARSISFPAISCGAYRFPPALAAPVALESAWQAAAQSAGVRELRFVLLHNGMRDLFAKAACRLGLNVDVK